MGGLLLFFSGATMAQTQDTRLGPPAEALLSPYKLSGISHGTLRTFWPFLAWGVIDLWQDWG